MINKTFSVIVISFISAFIGAFLALFLASGNFLSANSQKALVAGELRLADESGRTKMLLTLLRGKPRIFMLDDKGEYRLEMGLGDFGEPHIWLRDGDGAAKVQIALTKNGLPSFKLVDQKNQERAVWALSSNGEPTFIFRDFKGTDRLAIWQDQKEEGIAIINSKGIPLGAFSAKENDAARLSFFNKQGAAYYSVPK